MIRVMQTVGSDTRTCPCCGESHAVQECVVSQRVAAPGVIAEVPARYFYCSNSDEYFEDHELQAWNRQQAGGFFGQGPQMPPWIFERQKAAEVNGNDGRGNEGAQAV